jgi:Ca-activated chloride channel family protein
MNQHKYDIKNLVIAVLIWEVIFWSVYFSLHYYMLENVDAFQFENMQYLQLLYIVPVLVLGYIAILRWKNKTLTTLADNRLLAYLTSPISSLKSFFKFFLFRNAVVFIILALANPQYGRGKAKAVNEGIEVMVAIDISNSMRALDLDAKKDRLEIAKMSVERLLNEMHGDKVGIIVFAGDAFVQVPLTNDYRAAKMFLNTIRPEMMTNQGTSIGLAIDKAMTSFDMGNGVNKAIIVISDGEDHEGNAEEAAKMAYENGVLVSTVGMGGLDPAPFPDFQKGKAVGLKKDDNGKTVYTQLNEKMLKKVASAGGGVYTRADRTFVNLEDVLTSIREIEKKEMASQLYTDYEDQYQWFLAIGLLLLFVEFFLSEKRSGIVHKLQEYNG